MMRIGVYEKIKSPDQAPTRLGDRKPVGMCFVSRLCFTPSNERGWRTIANDPDLPDQRTVSARLVGGDLYIENEFIRNGTNADWKKYPQANYDLPIPIERHIHHLFKLPPRPNSLVPKKDLDFPWSEAVEWAGALGRASSFMPVRSALFAVVKAKYAEMDECHEAVAAAEVVAAAKGKPAKNLPEEVKQWVAKHQSKFDSSLVDLAIRAVERVRADSELQQEWDESASLNDWKKHVTGLLKRLKA